MPSFNLPLVQCPKEHKPYALRKHGLSMSAAMGQPMPYGYWLWTFTHSLKSGYSCGYREKRLVKSASNR